MSKRRFVRGVQQTMLPDVDRPGRLMRLVVDIDLTEVKNYIYDSSESATGWPYLVFSELQDVFVEIAKSEALHAAFARMHDEKRTGRQA